MIILRWLAASAALVVVAVGLAGPASADPLSGTYTATVTQATDTSGFGPPPIAAGDQLTWLLSPCGPDCTRVEVADRPKHALDLQAQGESWSGGPNAIGCSKTIDPGAATATEVCKSWIINYALTNNG